MATQSNFIPRVPAQEAFICSNPRAIWALYQDEQGWALKEMIERDIKVVLADMTTVAKDMGNIRHFKTLETVSSHSGVFHNIHNMVVDDLVGC